MERRGEVWPGGVRGSRAKPLHRGSALGSQPYEPYGFSKMLYRGSSKYIIPETLLHHELEHCAAMSLFAIPM